METNPVWNGPWGQSTGPVQKENISHTGKNLMSSGSAGEKPDMLFPQVAVDSTWIYCPLIIFVPWWGINNLNKGVRITTAALINNATAWLDAGWMEAPQATNPKWSPKETFRNELREVKRPVNNINNIQSEEKGALWCFNLFFPPLDLLLCRNMWLLSIPQVAETKELSPVAEFFLCTRS